MSLRTGLGRAARLSVKPRLPLSLFLRASHDASSDTRLEDFLRPLRYPDEPNAVRRSYLPLITELKRIKAEPDSPPLPPLLTRQQLVTVIELLATSGRPPDMECLHGMFSHLSEYFNVPVTPDLHSIVITALLKQGYVPLAQKWLLQLAEIPPQNPTLDNFHTFLRSCPDHTPFETLRYQVTRSMRVTGVRPTTETFVILIQRVISNAIAHQTTISPDIFTTIFADMGILRVPSDPQIHDLIQGYYVDLGLLNTAETVRKNYVASFPAPLTPEEQQRSAWNTQLSEIASQSGVKASLTLFHRLQSTERCTVDPSTFRAILRGSTSIDDLQRAEEVLGVKANASEYAVVVHNNIRMGQLDNALEVYEYARGSGIVPVAGLVGPLIRSLCATRRQPAIHNARIDSALALYSDLDEAFPPSDPDSPEALAAHDHSKHSFGPDIDIYTSLFHGLAMSSNVKASYPIAGALALDMKARGIKPTHSIRVSNIIMDIKNADNLDQAFKRYRATRSELGEAGYGVVLHAFSRLSHSMGHPDHLEYYFLIVGDMRIAGFLVTSRIYTDIMQQFAELAAVRRKNWRKTAAARRDKLRPMPSHIFEDLLDAVRQVHNVLSGDPMVTRDMVLWNQLMDTYQRLGSFPEAYRVWEMLFLSGKYGHIAVSIIFDACGYANNLKTAKDIAGKLMAEDFVFNLHNWNSYIECLCRVGDMSEALRVLSVVMGSARQPIKPDPSTVAVMLRFADTRIQTNTILQRIRRQLPALWHMLPQNSRQPENVERAWSVEDDPLHASPLDRPSPLETESPEEDDPLRARPPASPSPPAAEGAEEEPLHREQ
ncbi:hypothetical protein C8R46DRAFT_994718 [Mycena filopes]|nr:hypothetical protein C8R46DRAFT_994718 [Mycena filopes]